MERVQSLSRYRINIMIDNLLNNNAKVVHIKGGSHFILIRKCNYDFIATIYLEGDENFYYRIYEASSNISLSLNDFCDAYYQHITNRHYMPSTIKITPNLRYKLTYPDKYNLPYSRY